jgi:hypothetical protein
VKYVILIYHNPVSRSIWEGLSDERRAEGWAAYADLNKDLAASGELVVSEALADPEQAKRVTVRTGRPIASDGPFAEAKEHLAGFYLVDCASIERAVEIAARIPEAAHIEIEVRPVLELTLAPAPRSPE